MTLLIQFSRSNLGDVVAELVRPENVPARGVGSSIPDAARSLMENLTLMTLSAINAQ